ncbi:protein DGCR14 [Tripterygium wilfordii]|uniref:Protein DGCR14 n=1 Tax=Tripterygium wilfordii TaxID=458696 RepID=A0A7J7D4V2_TRIWF|nr:splicing factor ESS-2 homolog [Tripterygium wilfordii]KAF5741385.1 protein DGCR14 [Tripterygium wilfordii]
MLLSPGHSPRHLSSPSPSSYSFPNNALSNDYSSVTPTNHKKKATVLDEDTYVAAIEKIVERDFFPDISKLRDRLDWLEAVKTGDPMQIRDAQLKIIERRGKKVNDLNPGGRTQSHTPGSTFMRNFTPFDEFGKTPRTPGVPNSETSGGVDSGDGSDGIETALSLDEFFRRYTSEDNESFSKIIEKVNRKRKERYEYLTEGEKEDVKLLEDVKRDRITDGYGTSYQPPSTLEGWKYTAKNLLMCHPFDLGEAPLTEEERAVRLKSLTKEINRTNTHFHGKILDNGPKDDGTVEVLYNPVVGATPFPVYRDGDKAKKYDLDDLRKTPNQFYLESGKKAENGYSFVRTPSPAPGVDVSPFITWGEIEGTPLRLDTEDTPIDIGGSVDGPHFKIPYPPARDVKAHSLSRDAARKSRERSKMFQKPPLPSPLRGGSASPSRQTFSPAAQKFMRNAIAKSSSSIDETLRATYRGASPGSSTPKSLRSLSRFGRDGSMVSRSPSVREGSNPC